MHKLAVRSGLALLAALLLVPFQADASHISGIRITQTGNTGLMIDIDVTAFYVTTSTESSAYLGTYFNHIPAIDWGDGSTVPRYGYGPSTGIPLAASITTVNGVPVRAFRGSFSHTYGAPGNYTIAANTTCCPRTTPTYTVATGTILTTTFTTSTPFSTNATVTTSFVQNTLPVSSAAPGFSKAFVPDTVPVNGTSTLAFTIDNTASTLDDSALDFVDNLPAGLVVASPANVSTTCTGGTITAASGTAVVSYTGGVVSAGASCTIAVDIRAPMVGTFVNTTGDLTSAFGNSGSASDTLTVTSPPGFTKTFSPMMVAAGDVSTLTFIIDNTLNAMAATGLSFADNLPAGMTVATTANAGTTCTGGAITALPGTGVVSYSGGTVAGGATCTVFADVTISTGGDYDNISGPLSSSLGSTTPGATTATLTVGLAIPTLSSVGLAMLVLLIGLFAVFGLRRKAV